MANYADDVDLSMHNDDFPSYVGDDIDGISMEPDTMINPDISLGHPHDGSDNDHQEYAQYGAPSNRNHQGPYSVAGNMQQALYYGTSAHVGSWAPPDSELRYAIDLSEDRIRRRQPDHVEQQSILMTSLGRMPSHDTMVNPEISPMLVARRVPSRHSSCSSAPDLSERERLAQSICDMIDLTVEVIPGLDRQDKRHFLTNYDLHRIFDFASLRLLFKEFFKQNPTFLSPIPIAPQAPLTNEQATEPTLQPPNDGDATIDVYVKATIDPSRKALLALLLYQKHKALLTVFMRWLLSPNPNTPTDESLPLSISGWEALGIKRTYCAEIVQAQPMFTVARIIENQHLDVNINERLPFIETLADAKRGSSGTVQTTKIARGHWEIVSYDGTSFGNLGAPKTVAVKTFKENAIRNMDETTKDFNTEHGILKELKRYDVRHKMIMLDSGSFTIFTESGTPLSHALIFEPASFSLADFLVNQHRADVYSTKSTLLARLADVVDAVACLHDNLDVLHLDIKPDNILVFERGASHPADNQIHDQLVFKISDFGLARKIGTRPRKRHNDIEQSLNPSRSSTTPATRPAGTYQGPEIQETNSSRAGRGSDVWSLGCVTLMMLAFMLYGPPGVHKLKSRLEVEFLGKDGDQSLFYIRSDSYPWEKGDVEQTPYRYLQDFKPVTGPVPKSELYAAVNPRVIEWSNVLYERSDGEPQQPFIKQWLEVIFRHTLLIDHTKRIRARSLCATLRRIQHQWMKYENTAEQDRPTSLQLPRPSTIADASLLLPNTVPMPRSATTRLTSTEEADNIVLPLARTSRTLPPTAALAFSNETSAANLPTLPTASIRVDTLRALPDQISNSGPSTPRSARAHTSDLCLAIRENDPVAVRLEMENDTDQLRRHCADSMSTFPLHCAMKNQSYKAMEVLLEYADQSITNLQCGGRTVLEMACEKGGDPSALRLFCVFPLKFHFPDSVYRRYKRRLGVEAGIAFEELYAGINTKDKRGNEHPLRQTNSLFSITRPALVLARKVPEDLYKTANSETRTNRRSLRALIRRPFQTFTGGKTKQLGVQSERRVTRDSSQSHFRPEPISAVDTPYVGEEKPEEKHPSVEAVLSEPIDRRSLQQQSAPVAGTLIRRGDSLVAPVDVLLERVPFKSGDDAQDTHREPKLREISSASFSTDGTLVGTAGRTDGSSSFSMYQHRTPSTTGLEKDCSDIASLRSRTDVSEVGSSATLVEYQHTASDVIAKAFLEKQGLSDTYDKAIKAVGIERFTRNNARLLLDLAVELRADRMLPSETLVVRLLMTGSGARLISAAICEEIEPNKGLRPQVKLEAIEDRKIILNRFLSTANAEVKPNFAQDTQPLVDDPADHKIDIPDYKRDGDAMSIASMSDADLEEVLTADPKLEDLEATVRFIMSGAPFELYQERLRNWLDPPAPVKETEQVPSQMEDQSQKGASEDLLEDDFDPEFSTSMTARNAPSDLPTSTVDIPTSQTQLCVEPKVEDRTESCEEETNRHSVTQETDHMSSADVRVRDMRNKPSAVFDEPNTSTIKIDAPPTILQTGAIESASGKSQEKSEPTASKNDEVRSTRLGISSWHPVMALPPTLPLLVEKILRYLPIPYFEPPIAEGKTRVRWTSGNRRRYDDFVEIDPGAAKALEKSLKVRYRNSSWPPSADESGPGVFRFIFNVLRGQDRQQTREDAEQGPAELEMTDVAQPSTTESEQLEADDIAEEKEVRLLLCIDNGRSRTKLKQEILRGINNDFKLFEHLHTQYFSASRWFTVRTAGTVSLVHFNVNLSKSTTVFKHDGTCTTTTREHLHPSRRRYCLCIPPESRVGPEYECSPAPKVQRHPRSVPVLGPTMLLGDLMDPGQINREQRTTFLQLPKRICGELKATAEAEELGWGLHIEEGWHWPTLYCCFFTVCSLSLLFGIIWSVKRDDIQGAFAVSSYVLTLGAMFVGYMAVPRT